jgi:predicted permease
MYWLRRILLWLPGRRRTRALDLQEELRANLSLAVDDAAESGLPSNKAARMARRDFGSLTRAQEESRAVWLPGWDAFAQDLRFAWRTLYRAPAFTLVAILSLALGIGAASALFSLVNTVVLKPLAYREPGRLVYVREVVPPLAHIYPTLPVNFEHYHFWRDRSRAFETLSALASGNAVLAGGDPELVGTALVTANFFETLGVQPQLGRAFLPDEEQPSRSLVAVITDSLWRRRFGASPGIAGQTIRLDGTPCTVAGVLPPSFRFPKNGELGPLTRLAERTEIFLPIQSANNGWGGDYDYMVFGRLRRDASLAQGVGELNLFEKRIAAEHQLSNGLRVEGRPLQEVIGSPVRTSLTVLLSAVLLLVLIVCVNLANLLLARSSARAREYSLRVALGAARGRLLISALVETLLLSCAGGALGIAAAWAALNAFVQLAPVDLPRMDEARMDGRVIAFAFGLSLLCALLFGLLPALRLSRADPQNALRESRAMTPGRHGLRLREWLVGAEVALSALLLVLAGLLVSSLWHVLHVDRGFAADRALAVSPALPAQYRTTQDKAGFFDLAAGRLRALPGVRLVAVANKLPLTGEASVDGVVIEGAGTEAVDPASRQLVLINRRLVSQDYFAALGIPVLRGRPIEAADRDRNVAVVSARLAAKLWPGRNPLGKIVSSGSAVKHAEVVGVVADVHSTQLERDPTLMLYVPFWKQAYQATEFVVRSAADPASLREEVRKTLQSIDPAIPAPKMRTMEEIVDESVAQRRFQMRVAAAFGVSALLLAALGIYGVVAYGIALRRRELGIRMALGARTQQVWRMVVWQGLRPVTAGLAVGMLAALAAGRLVRSLLFGVSATDGLTLGAVAAGLACVATLACLLPARYAARIDPSRVLRDE